MCGRAVQAMCTPRVLPCRGCCTEAQASGRVAAAGPAATWPHGPTLAASSDWQCALSSSTTLPGQGRWWYKPLRPCAAALPPCSGKYDGPEAERLAALRLAALSGAAYVDVELKIAPVFFAGEAAQPAAVPAC